MGDEQTAGLAEPVEGATVVEKSGGRGSDPDRGCRLLIGNKGGCVRW